MDDIIRNLRKRHYLTQAEFAKKVGVTQGTVSQWENGLTRPNLDQLRSISSIFGVSIDSLLNTQAPVYTEIRRSAIPILGSIACGERIAPDLNPGGYADLPEGVRADSAC